MIPAAGAGQRRAAPRFTLLGPAMVAAVAYVDPGNVATNTSAGSKYGYLLLWVLVLATIVAGVMQYLSAALGAATGQSLPELVGRRLSSRGRTTYWLQAELIAMATDVAEVVGGVGRVPAALRLAAAGRGSGHRRDFACHAADS